MRCVKDWITQVNSVTQVNSGHRDRFARPDNVRVVAKP
jgi:hypothetical protein